MGGMLDQHESREALGEILRNNNRGMINMMDGSAGNSSSNQGRGRNNNDEDNTGGSTGGSMRRNK
jgi:hypothetical protein